MNLQAVHILREDNAVDKSKALDTDSINIKDNQVP